MNCIICGIPFPEEGSSNNDLYSNNRVHYVDTRLAKQDTVGIRIPLEEGILFH